MRLCRICKDNIDHLHGNARHCNPCQATARDNAILGWQDRNPVKTAEIAARANKKYYSRCQVSGLCVSCGKTPALKGRVRCESCHEKNREYTKRWRKK